MNKIFNYISANFNEASDAEIKKFVEDKCSVEDCIDFMNMLITIEETTNDIKSFIASKL